MCLRILILNKKSKRSQPVSNKRTKLQLSSFRSLKLYNNKLTQKISSLRNILSTYSNRTYTMILSSKSPSTWLFTLLLLVRSILARRTKLYSWMPHNTKYKKYTVMVQISTNLINLITNHNTIFSNYLLNSPLNRAGYLRRISVCSQMSPLVVLVNPQICPSSKLSNRVYALVVARKGTSSATAPKKTNRCIQWLQNGLLLNDILQSRA